MNPITREESLLDGQDLTPITRKEQFIKRIYDKTQEIPEPITREEWFLKKAGEGTSPVTIEQLNVTENGTYSEQGKAYSPVIVEVPEPTLITKSITANGTYNASEDNADGYSSVTVAVEGFKKKSIANTPTDIASFNDGTANPMPSLEISIEPQQDLHGYDYPWVGGANLNLLRPGEAKTYTSNGITFTSDGSGKYTIKGTATAGVNCTFDCEEYTTPDGSNTTLMFMNTATNPNVAFEFYRNTTLVDNWSLSVTNRMQYPFIALSQKTINKYNIFVAVGSTVDMTISPMFITGDVTANPPSFRPYSNICPISGHTEADVTVTDDLTTPTTTHTLSIPFHDSNDNPITVYGGRLNVTSGSCLKYESAINLSSIDSFSSDEVNASGYIRYNCTVSDKAQNYNIMCDKIKVINTTVRVDASSEMISGSSTNNRLYFTIDSTRLTGDLSTANGRNQALKTLLQTDDIQVAYELATPQTYQLTPTQVSTLLGQNNIFADCGQILEGEYFVTL